MVRSYDLDLDGNGRADLLFQGQLYNGPYGLVVWADGDYRRATYLPLAYPRDGEVRFGDLDGDGRSEIISRDTNGVIVAWPHGDPRASVPVGSVSTDYLVGWDMYTGDFAGDGRADLLFWKRNTGDLVIWKNGDFRDSQLLGFVDHANGSRTEHELLIGDFTGDGKDDIWFRQRGNQAVTLWSAGDSSEARFLGYGNAVPIDVGDFNGDGVSDALVGYSNSTYDVYIWLGGDPNDTTGSLGMNFRRAYHVADLNGDGRSELIVQGGSSNPVPSGIFAADYAQPTIVTLIGTTIIQQFSLMG